MSKLNLNVDVLKDMDAFISKENIWREYHKKHIHLVYEYAKVLNERLGNKLDNNKLQLSAYAHDILKESSLVISKDGTVFYEDINIPQDLRKYIKDNKEITDSFGLPENINNEAMFHGIAISILMKKEFGIDDMNILYPIIFHSCIIVDIYEKLSEETQLYIDAIRLADKLSSNYLKLNAGKKVRCFIEDMVFGPNNDFNFTIGVYIARLIGGTSDNELDKKAIKFEYDRVRKIYPFIDIKKKKELGEKKLWEKRNSKVLPIEVTSLETLQPEVK